MIRRHWLTWVLVGVLVLIVGAGLLVKFGMEKAQADEILAKFPDRGVPRMNITLNGVTLDEINAGSKDVKYEGNEAAVYEGSEMVGEYGNVRVKGRGNATWQQEKKPYQIKFRNQVNLLGLGKAKRWALLANSMDNTFLRNEAGFNLEKMLNMKFRFEGAFVELYVDDEYLGLYYLTHDLEIGKGTVDLRDAMGVLVELDNLYGINMKYYKSNNGDMLTLKDDVSKDSDTLAMEDFLKAFNQLEEAIEKRDYEKVQDVADVDSLAEYFILSEFSVNPDAYWTSFYFYKDGVNDKIHAGPGWDFDLAFGSKKWTNWTGDEFHSPIGIMARKKEFKPIEFYEEAGIIEQYEASLKISKLLYDLYGIPEFENKVKNIFRERMSGRADQYIQSIMVVKERIAAAAQENNKIWYGQWSEKGFFDLMDWIKKRYEYFESLYGDKGLQDF